MKNEKKTVARLDDGIWTHVKINGRTYRRDTIIRALKAYRDRISLRRKLDLVENK